MTRTLGKQINDPRTKYNRLSLSVNPGISSSTLSAATVHALSVSGIPGGADENVPPKIIGTTVEPYVMPISSIGVRIDGGVTTTVSFTATDTNASRVAKKINDAVPGADIAFFFGGKLMLKSNGAAGVAGSIQLSNISGTPLTILGLPVGTINGFNNDTRGILTNDLNDNGGYVPLRLAGKQALVTNAGSLAQISSSAGDISYNSALLGGSPIYGRLSFDGTNYLLNYFTALPANAEVHTFASDFAAVTGADSINVTITANGGDLSTAIVFGAGPNTRDTIMDRINEVWSQFINGTGRVNIRGSVSQPYTFNNEVVHVSVNNAAEVQVTLVAADDTVAEVVSKFNAVPGLSASPAVTPYGIVLQLTTTTGTGAKSSISLRDEPAEGHNALSKLGISAGTYVGPHIAKSRGAFEITLFAPNRGERSKIAITCSSTTATRLGLSGTSVIVTASNNEVDIPVTLPSLARQGQQQFTSPVINSYQIEAIFPEILSFGEIPTNYVSEQEEYDNSATGANNDSRRDFTPISDATLPIGFRNSLNSAGQVVVAGPDGLVDMGQMRRSTDLLMRFLKQFLSGNFHTGLVSGIIANSISTTGTGPNPLPDSPSLTINVDPDGAFPSASRLLDIRFGNPATSDYRFVPDLFTAQGGLNIGNLFTASLATSRITPKVTYNLASSSPSDRQLVWMTQTPTNTSRGKIRIYVQPATSTVARYEIVTNAAWDGSVWTKDNTSADAAIMEIGGFFEGVRYRHQNDTVVSFAEGDWEPNFTFPIEPTVGNENSFERALRLGQTLADSGSDTSATSPRLLTDFNGAQPRVLLWQMDSDLTNPSIRIYAAAQSIHAGVQNNTGIEITYNARWDAAANLWVVDSVNNQATKFYIGDSGFALKTTGSFPLSTFNDGDTSTGWQCTHNLTGSVGASSNEKPPTALLWKAVNAITGQQFVDLFFPGPFVFHNNTITAVPKANALHANLIPKITGRIFVNFGVVTQFEGFGMQAPSVVGNTIAFPWLYAPDDGTQVVVLAQMMSSGGTSTITILSVTNAFQWNLQLRNSATGANVNFSTSTFSFSVALFYEHTP